MTTTDKPAKTGRRTDVDALLSEVAGASKVKAGTPARTGAAPVSQSAPVAPVAAGPAAKKTVRVRQLRSGICTPSDQKAALKALGLRRIRHEVELPDNPSTRGQILKVRHLVVVVE